MAVPITSYGEIDFMSFNREFNAQTGYNTNYGYSDFLFLPSRIFAIGMNMNYVFMHGRSADGTVGSSYPYKSWQAQDNYISQICSNNSSVPVAYAAYNYEDKDYLIGWSSTVAQLLIWEIDVAGNISNRRTIPAPKTCSTYSRAGWDGQFNIFFFNRNGNGLYRFNLITEELVHEVTLDSDQGISSSWTGSGLLVTKEYVYAPAAANSSTGFMAMWDRKTGVSITPKLTDLSQVTAHPYGAQGLIQVDVCFPQYVYFFAGYKVNVKILNIEGVSIGNATIKIGKPSGTVPKGTDYEFPFQINAPSSSLQRKDIKMEDIGELTAGHRQLRIQLDKKEFIKIVAMEVQDSE
ncbi:hypothetical protein [Peribacillus frigoritolerans]|uniref:Uncharacterized protein n=1 Tax=Peribacillus castrilensis TaxID=2897690 RepID=A0AAW9NMH7_9BACI|nr:hypothetical protein [Peribacillus castrilensis]